MHIYLAKNRYSIVSKNYEMGTERMLFFKILYGIITVYISSNNELLGERKMEENTLPTAPTTRQVTRPTLTTNYLCSASPTSTSLPLLQTSSSWPNSWPARTPAGSTGSSDDGFTLQNAGAGVLRCIHLVDAEYAFLCLAMANETIKLAGGVLELAPYTVVRPMNREADDEATSAKATVSSEPATVGMEVA